MTLSSPSNYLQLKLENIINLEHPSQQNQNQEELGRTFIDSTVDLCFCGRPVRPATCNLLTRVVKATNKCSKCESLWTNYRSNSLEWDWLFFLQGGKCANEFCDNTATALDHCHDTNTIRQLLCLGCNTSLGLLNEDVLKMLGLVRYKLKHI